MSEHPAALQIHLLRHGRVASHRGDVPLTEEGRREIAQLGLQLAARLLPAEEVYILHAAPRRTGETAEVLHASLLQARPDAAHQGIVVHEPCSNAALRTPDLYVAGTRVEMVSSAAALRAQLPASCDLAEEALARLPFWQRFWSVPDRIGYWVNLPDPPGENALCAARRLLTFVRSLADGARGRPRRYLCVTHSPLLRAFLRSYLYAGADPGEPEYGEAIELVALAGSGSSLVVRYRGRETRLG
jgi:broad specificity phosphatase PhoE